MHLDDTFVCPTCAVDTSSGVLLLLRPPLSLAPQDWWDRLTSGIRSLQPFPDVRYFLEYPVLVSVSEPVQRNAQVCVAPQKSWYVHKAPGARYSEKKEILGGWWRGIVSTTSIAGCQAPAVPVNTRVDAFKEHMDAVLQARIYSGLDSRSANPSLEKDRACNPKAGYGPSFTRIDIDNEYVLEVDPPSLGEQSKLVLTNSVSGCSVIAAWDPVRLKLLLYHQKPDEEAKERFLNCDQPAIQLMEKHLFQRATLRGMTPFAVVGPSLYRSSNLTKLVPKTYNNTNPISSGTIIVELATASASQWQAHIAMQVRYDSNIKVSMVFPRDRALWKSLQAGQQSVVTLASDGFLNEVAFVTSDRFCVEQAGEPKT